MKEIKLQNSAKMVLVDDEDFERLNQFKWFLYNEKRAPERFTLKRTRRTRTMSNEVMNNWTSIYDHRDRNPLNNQKINLREATRSQNAANRPKFRGTFSSQYKGACWLKREHCWRAYIKNNGKLITIGQFDLEKDAALAYNSKALELFGEFALLNVIVT